MATKRNNWFERTNEAKSTVQQEKRRRAARYNYKDMNSETADAKQRFADRLTSLRIMRGVSAREMSLSLGQGAGYISNIENGGNLPSMAMFFEICEYLNVSPGEFFFYSVTSRLGVLAEAIGRLQPEDQELLLTLARKMRKENL